MRLFRLKFEVQSMDALVEVLVSRQDRSLPIVELDVSHKFW
jgi:hypothetical protein